MDDFFSADIHGGHPRRQGLVVANPAVLGEVPLVVALVAEHLGVGALAVDVPLRVAIVAKLA
eukprot:3573411-Prymnesium_polylepis.1